MNKGVRLQAEAVQKKFLMSAHQNINKGHLTCSKDMIHKFQIRYLIICKSKKIESKVLLQYVLKKESLPKIHTRNLNYQVHIVHLGLMVKSIRQKSMTMEVTLQYGVISLSLQ